MKKFLLILLIILLLVLSSCDADDRQYQIIATTLPVYDFTVALCSGTDLTVGQLVTEQISCLHDYSLSVSQMRMLNSAQLIVMSGAGLEDFFDGSLFHNKNTVNASTGAHIHSAEHHNHEDHGHNHDTDPHIWLSPENAKAMCQSICQGLIRTYPEHEKIFAENLLTLYAKLDTLQVYGQQILSQLRERKIITFHDGFAYFAESFDLQILMAVEEESGSEASAGELKELIQLVRENDLPAVFIEKNGSVSAAQIIQAETGCRIYPLDMAMSGNDYFEIMYRNIDTIKEALG